MARPVTNATTPLVMLHAGSGTQSVIGSFALRATRHPRRYTRSDCAPLAEP